MSHLGVSSTIKLCLTEHWPAILVISSHCRHNCSGINYSLGVMQAPMSCVKYNAAVVQFKKIAVQKRKHFVRDVLTHFIDRLLSCKS